MTDAAAPIPAPTDIAPLPSLPAPERARPRGGRVPLPLTSFVGRARELDAVLDLVRRAAVRLLTLTGPGGIGKTRLALRVAAELDDDFADGVVFVPLAPIRDPTLALSTIAQACGVRETGERPPLELLTAHLATKQLLLVLDNLEHVLAAAPTLIDLLVIAPRLKLLVTSRATLRVSGEYVFPVPALTVPEVARSPSVDEIATAEAVRLFVDRAQAANPTFALTDGNATAVADICRGLDGLPLAIELAAARSTLFAPAALRGRLVRSAMASPLHLLTDGPRDAPPRLRTMRDAIAWSYDLLEPTEQALCRCLAVFAGGFTIDAVEGMRDEGRGMREDDEAAASSSLIPHPSALDLLASLVDKSLVQRMAEADAESVEVDAAVVGPRFTMLETIREYALDRLRDSGEEADAGRRHAAHYLALAEDAEPRLVGPEQRLWFERLETERDNLRAALVGAAERGEAETALRLAGALWRFWAIRGYLVEGRAGLERVLALPGSDAAPTAARAKALQHLGNLALDLGDYDAALVHYTAGLALQRAAGDRRGIANALNGLGLIANYRADYPVARRLYEESLALRRALGDQQGMGNSLNNLGVTAIAERDYARAQALVEEGLAVRRATGDTGAVAYSLFCLGEIAVNRGDGAAARGWLEQSLGLFREVGDRLGIGYALSNLGVVAHRAGDESGAAALFAEALTLRQELGDRRGVIECLEGLAAVAGAAGAAESGARLFGAAAAQRAALDVPLRPADRDGYEREVAALRAKLGSASFAAAWAAGGVLAFEQAVAEALAAERPAAATDRSVPSASVAVADHGLSPRELDVLRLIAAGRSNQEIAAALFITLPTTKAHLTHIYAKLGVTSRSAATAYAHRHGLVGTRDEG